jgi:DNA uptake protein ComE-like DNA-binding protein
MLGKRFLAFTALIGLAATPALAQSTAPVSPSRPAVTTPAMPATPSPMATTPVTKRTNLNTATAAELDALPEVGSARAKVILDERSKGKFKDWADFDHRMAGTSINAGVKAKIKDLVAF